MWLIFFLGLLHHITFYPSFAPLSNRFGFSLTNIVSVGIKALVQWLDIINMVIMLRYMRDIIKILKLMF